jgi:hypothetical protein
LPFKITPGLDIFQISNLFVSIKDLLVNKLKSSRKNIVSLVLGQAQINPSAPIIKLGSNAQG